jgi:hypothetical protein
MTATASGSLYEVQGLALCPAHGDHHPRRTSCPVPDEGEWHAIFFVDTRSEADEAYNHVIDSDSVLYEKFQDFRVAVPDPDKLRRRREGEGYIWDRKRPRRPAESRTTIHTGKKGKRRKQAA